MLAIKPRQSHWLHLTRSFTSCTRVMADSTGAVDTRAIVFAQHGDPTQVLRGHKYQLPALKQGQVRVKFELSAINPADINVIQGTYPQRPEIRNDIGPEPLSIMGNEGTGVIEGLPDGHNQFKIGDKVVMRRPQQGTWQSRANLPSESLLVLPSSDPISDVHAATLSINPPTALRMLSDFVPLNPEQRDGADKKEEKQQWVIQNGANSAVGVAVIQLAKSWGVKTINLVRDREDIDALKSQLKSLGADHVLTYDEFLQRETRAKVKEWTSDGEMRLALNCVGGKETAEMVKLLSMDGFLVTYGGMARMALSIPPSLFIFKRLTATGFWLSEWSRTHPDERAGMMHQLTRLCSTGQLQAPETEMVKIPEDVDEMTRVIREVMKRAEGGKGKKVLIKF